MTILITCGPSYELIDGGTDACVMNGASCADLKGLCTALDDWLGAGRTCSTEAGRAV